MAIPSIDSNKLLAGAGDTFDDFALLFEAGALILLVGFVALWAWRFAHSGRTWKQEASLVGALFRAAIGGHKAALTGSCVLIFTGLIVFILLPSDQWFTERSAIEFHRLNTVAICGELGTCGTFDGLMLLASLGLWCAIAFSIIGATKLTRALLHVVSDVSDSYSARATK